MVTDTLSQGVDSTFLIPDEPPPTKLGDQKITEILDELFKWPNAAGQYAAYFLLLPAALDLKENVAGLKDIEKDGPCLYEPYATKQHVGIQVQGIRDLKDFGYPFAPQYKNDPGNDPGNANYVKLDAFGVLVPIPVAQLVAACFTHGLVTRLILGEYFRAWNKDAGSTDTNEVRGFADTFQEIPRLLDWTKNNGHYGADEAAYMNGESFHTAITRILLAHPVQPAGLLLGWKAGLELDGGDAEYKKCVWRLLNSRFKISEIGGMVGFTLNYLSGYIKNERIAEIADSVGRRGSATLDISEISTKVSNDKGVNFARELLRLFHSNLISQFYALSQNESTNLSPVTKQHLLARLAGFLRGFQVGSTTAADQVLGELFSLAYGIGYRNGFRDGYDQGYVAGWKDGYASGYATAWKEAKQVIEKLQNELANADAQNEMWNTIGKGVDLGTKILPYLASAA